MANSTTPQRQESDRHQKKTWLTTLISRPEIGPIGVMLTTLWNAWIFFHPAGEMSWNPFTGEGFNALGIRNFLRVISQLGIIAIGAGLLIISGEFDLSIGSMIGFAGACMAMILRWGFSVIIPYFSFDGGFHIEFYTLFHLSDVSPIMAIFITLCLHFSLAGYREL
jgi:simple sugar transport system permease protein